MIPSRSLHIQLSCVGMGYFLWAFLQLEGFWLVWFWLSLASIDIFPEDTFCYDIVGWTFCFTFGVVPCFLSFYSRKQGSAEQKIKGWTVCVL